MAEVEIPTATTPTTASRVVNGDKNSEADSAAAQTTLTANGNGTKCVTMVIVGAGQRGMVSGST